MRDILYTMLAALGGYCEQSIEAMRARLEAFLDDISLRRAACDDRPAPVPLAIVKTRSLAASEARSGAKRDNDHVTERVAVACGFFIAALHRAGLAAPTHAANLMGFRNEMLNRPADEKPAIRMVVGQLTPDAAMPIHAARKKPFADRMSVF